MRITTRLLTSLGLSTAALLTAGIGVSAQGAGHAHIGHVADAFANTPGGRGLLATAVAEAEVAVQHAELAASNATDVDVMKRHAGHVLHALDPSVVASGPGAGYGVKQAASGVARHIELAAGTEGASAALGTHATHIATAARSAESSADAAIGVARQLQAAASAAEAAPLATRLVELAGTVLSGRDADGDGRIGWQAGEGGLAQATQHVSLLKTAEGLNEQ
jgi:hypothetical protein